MGIAVIKIHVLLVVDWLGMYISRRISFLREGIDDYRLVDCLFRFRKVVSPGGWCFCLLALMFSAVVVRTW
ncbi:hypothetical protein F5Y17DRAFT_446568 [Xylariaceae sp. FL0594]|nr:hypothetical protein F5Y17DRAFT_446568 [Xylariaceae sp. FL0594]